MNFGKWTRLLFAAIPLMAGCAGFWDAPTNSNGGTTTTTLSSGNFYILSKGSSVSQIYGFSIVSGKLTPLTNSPYAVTGVAFSIAMDPTGSFLYVSSSAGGGAYIEKAAGRIHGNGKSHAGYGVWTVGKRCQLAGDDGEAVNLADG